MSTTQLTLEEIRSLAFDCLTKNGADEPNADALAENIEAAERNGSLAHGLFRLPAYVASLRSGKVNGEAKPTLRKIAPAAVGVHGDNCFAPVAHKIGIPALKETAKETGAAALSITCTHHMGALWQETEAVANHGLACIACTCYLPAVAPAGAKQPLLGTNPLAFAWPRPGQDPLSFDMATATMAMGEVQIAAREERKVPFGVGLDKAGNPTTEPSEISTGGVLLPFGGYKGSAISIMIELLSAGLLGETFSFESKENDNKDGGPPQGGQLLLALSPDLIAGTGWEQHCEKFFDRLTSMEGVRLPGERRHRNRQSTAPREINTQLLGKIRGLM